MWVPARLGGTVSYCFCFCSYVVFFLNPKYTEKSHCMLGSGDNTGTNEFYKEPTLSGVTGFAKETEDSFLGKLHEYEARSQFSYVTPMSGLHSEQPSQTLLDRSIWPLSLRLPRRLKWPCRAENGGTECFACGTPSSRTVRCNRYQRKGC